MTTHISDLPATQTMGSMNTQGNIKLETTETPPPAIPNYQSDVGKPNIEQTTTGAPDQKQLNTIVAGIQQASAAGATSLPSRDIPQQTTHIMQDPNTTPNFIPETVSATSNYYIPDEDPNVALKNQEAQVIKRNAYEDLYNQAHIPVIVAILFMLFQLPVTRKYFKQMIPFGFNSDGNQNIIGYMSYSLLFGAIFFGINTFIHGSI